MSASPQPREAAVFAGYRRAGDRCGVRNHLLVVPTVICSAVVAERAAAAIERELGRGAAVALPHLSGCGQLGPDMQTTHRTLKAYCRHPNVGAVLVVALGCEQVTARALELEAKRAGKPAAIVAIQQEGGTVRAQAAAITRGLELAREIAGAPRVEIPISKLILGLECGGSDATSGLAANPALGWAADRLIALGGAAVLSETAEILGAEHLLGTRAAQPATAEKLYQIVSRVEDQARALGLDIRGTQPAPGNIAGGLTTIEEKSLGAVAKAGRSSALESALEYADSIPGPGLHFMDTPGFDVESVTGMVAGGAQVVVFTTGLGTPTGNPIAPVIKITGNERTAETMRDNLDLDSSGILSGRETLEEVGRRLLELVAETASGRETATERLGHREVAIFRRNSTI
ncbi:MAG TPA: UxaA family hydrolase [Thermoanaerobaculia bacterium]|nr:UxaA family hydrolase [Thermoanaerobaculia bacterium]